MEVCGGRAWWSCVVVVHVAVMIIVTTMTTLTIKNVDYYNNNNNDDDDDIIHPLAAFSSPTFPASEKMINQMYRLTAAYVSDPINSLPESEATFHELLSQRNIHGTLALLQSHWLPYNHTHQWDYMNTSMIPGKLQCHDNLLTVTQRCDTK